MSDEGGRRREEAPLTVSLPLCGIAGEDAHVPGLGKFNMMCQMYTFDEHPHGDVDAHNLHRSGYIILSKRLPTLFFLTRLSQVENALKGQKHIAQGSALGINTDRNYAL